VELSRITATYAARSASAPTLLLPEIRGSRGAAIAARRRALSEWELANPGIDFDPEWFTQEILPGLASVKFSDIEATGMNKASASDVLRGKWTPHVSAWSALEEVAGASPPVSRLSRI